MHYKLARNTGLLLALLTFLSAMAVSLHAATPAGTQIRNQASATYTDSAGRSQTSTSNEVINVVAAIHALEILPNQGDGGDVGTFSGAPALTQATAAGNIVYYSYYLTNESNVADRFSLRFIQSTADDADASRVAIYVDVNGDGQVDPGDLKLVDSNDVGVALAASDFADSALTPVVQPDDTLRLVVAVTVPSTSNTGSIDIDIDARSDGDNSVTDSVGNFNRTTVTEGKGIIAAYKSVDVQSAGPGDTLTYTIQGGNVGAANVEGRLFEDNDTEIRIDLGAGAVDTTGILIVDNLHRTVIESFIDISTIDFGVSGSASFGDAVFLFGRDSGTFIEFVQADTAAAADTAFGGGDPVDRVAIYFPNRTLSPGQSFSASFAVDVEENSVFTGSAALSLIENTATVHYNDGDGSDEETTTNAAQTQVDNRSAAGNLGVAFSPYTFADGTTAAGESIEFGTDRDISRQHPEVDNTTANTYSLVANGNTTTADNRNAGEFFAIPLTVTNTGGATDTYNITFVNGLPSGYQVFLFQSDGVTPLGDTNSDGTPDSGPIAPGGFRDIVVKILIPGNAAETTDAGLITLTATSAIDGSITSDTLIDIQNVRPAGVDIAVEDQTFIASTDTVASHDDTNATGVGDSAGNSVVAGAFTTVPVDVRNVRAVTGTEAERLTGSPDTYTLSWDADPAIRSSWTVNFFRRDGGGEPTGQPISDTRDLDPNELSQLVAVILVPSTALAGTYIIDLTATSTNNTGINDTMYVEVIVEETPIIEIDPDNTATVVRGGTTTFRHTLFNLGNTDEDVTLTLNSADGYQVVFVDSDGTVLGETLSGNDYDTSPGDEIEIFVRVFIPQNAPVGSSSIFTVTATSAGNAPSDTAVNIVQVIDGNLQLTKSSSVVFDPGNGRIIPTSPDADPGAGTPTRFDNLYPLRYTTTYQNLGSQPITNVVIIDQVPANTRLVVEAKTNPNVGPAGANTLAPTAVHPNGGTVTIEYSTNGGISWGPAPTAADDGSVSGVTHIRFRLDPGSLAPGESESVSFDVLVN
ncbi:MAG: hypothetical protein JJU20_04955 [Opitutales bacterium]|nr:hypothetical protein [Opitutales bacterium]